MANVLNRKTMDYLFSVNTPEYDPVDWMINPDLTEVEHTPHPYWKIVDETVVPMTDRERINADLWAPYMHGNLDEAIAYKSELVNQYRTMRTNQGWLFYGTRYDSDDQARQNMTGTMALIATGYTLPEDFTWRARDNTNIPFDNVSFTGFYQASCAWMEMNYRVSWQHKAEIAALATVEEIAAYDLTKDYPDGFPLG